MTACRKVRYLDPGSAAAGLRHLLDDALRNRRRIPRADRERLSAYRCRACGFWHLGKSRRPVRSPEDRCSRPGRSP